MQERGTTHLSVVDFDLNAAALTATIESDYGARRMAGGFRLNNQLTDLSLEPVIDGKPETNAVAPRKAPRSSMSPTIVTDGDGRLALVAGSMGGSTMIASVSRSIIGVLDWGLTSQEAVSTPALFARTPAIACEAGRMPPATVAALRARGWNLVAEDFCSGTHVIQVTPDGLCGGAVPRLDGVAGALAAPADWARHGDRAAKRAAGQMDSHREGPRALLPTASAGDAPDPEPTTVRSRHRSAFCMACGCAARPARQGRLRGAPMGGRVPISDPMLEASWHLAPDVVERHARDGRADRRETAVITLLAGLVPAVGLFVLDWAPGTVIACTMVNLVVLLLDDLAEAALAAGSWRSIAEQAAEDDYVWHLGTVLLRGGGTVLREYADGVRRLSLPILALWPLSLVSLGLAAFSLLLTLGTGATIPVQSVAWGALPNLLVMLGSHAAGACARNPHWRRAGSTRHGSAIGSAFGLFVIGCLSMLLVLGPAMPDGDRLTDASAALLISAGAVVFGGWRLHRLANCDAIARWLGSGRNRARRGRRRRGVP